MIFEVLKRAVPFAAAMALGIFAALPFLGASSSSNTATEIIELKKENQRLKRENCRLKKKMGRIHGFRHSEMKLYVPAPPAPPVAPVAPPAPPAPPAG